MCSESNDKPAAGVLAMGCVTTQKPSRNHSEETKRRGWHYREVMETAGLRYHGCTLRNFVASNESQHRVKTEMTEFCRNIQANVAGGRNLILFGPTGTGKDHLMAAGIRAAIRDVGASVKWANGVELFARVRDNMKNGGSEKAVANEFTEPDVLAISDPVPPMGGLTNFQMAFLQRIIDARYRRFLATWITINVANGREAEERIGTPAVDRLRHGCLQLFCNWGSYRKGIQAAAAED
ncbi:ATP-binding protein [Symmachiella dynata]|uniref:ATP-binding protein n=1 Tax=Symmachiella dynata TaxID=2527995 RepID=UPI0030EDBE6E